MDRSRPAHRSRPPLIHVVPGRAGRERGATVRLTFFTEVDRQNAPA